MQPSVAKRDLIEITGFAVVLPSCSAMKSMCYGEGVYKSRPVALVSLIDTTS